jgi:hypothetical protein
MRKRLTRQRRLHMTSMGACVLLLTGLMVVPLPAASAQAAGTVLYQNAFADRTVDGTGSVTVATPTSGTNAACLTASGNSATGPLLSCSGTADAQGGGVLRLTSSASNQVGGVFGQSGVPTANGLDITFNSYQWGGFGGDGQAFLLAAVDPGNPAAPANIASSGGALGYSTTTGVNGLVNAYLGVGLDVFGNFSNASSTGTGCGVVANFGARSVSAVAVRGPGSLRAGYCGLVTTYDGTAGSKVTLRATTRAASVVPMEVLINPTASTLTAASGVSVAAGTYKIVFTPVGSGARTLTGALPTVPNGLYPSASWLNAAGVPKQLAFGFVGSTGSVTDAHEISNVKVVTFNPVPELAVAVTDYSTPTPVAGAPVTYTVTPSLLTGADETVPFQ